MKHQFLSGIFLILITSGCAGISVQSDYDRQANFSGIKTYSWVSESQPLSGDIRIDNTLFDSRIRSAVDQTLASKGYQKVSGGSPDFLVAYQAAIQGKLDVTTIDAPYYAPSVRGGLPAGGSWDWAHGGTETFVMQYEEGSVYIDIIHPSTKKVIWRGTGKATVLEKASPEKREARINQGVQQILAHFPPGS